MKVQGSFNIISIFPRVSFPGSSDGKESACNAGDLGLTPGSGRSPGEGNGSRLQYSGLENPMDRPWGHKELDMMEPLTLWLPDWPQLCPSDMEVCEIAVEIKLLKLSGPKDVLRDLGEWYTQLFGPPDVVQGLPGTLQSEPASPCQGDPQAHVGFLLLRVGATSCLPASSLLPAAAYCVGLWL